MTTSMPSDQVRVVHFWVDDDRFWRDRDPPFAYGEDGAQLGTWVGDGKHRFTVRVVATDGSRAAETVVASVDAPKTDERLIERGLWGYYMRLSPADARTPPPPGKDPHFTASMWLDLGRTFSVGTSPDQAFSYEYWIGKRTLHIGTGWYVGTPGKPAKIAGWAKRGSQCEAGEWPAHYTWTREKGRFLGRFSGQDRYAFYLILKARKEPCDERRRTLEGVWESFGI